MKHAVQLAILLSLALLPLSAQEYTAVDHWGRGAYQAITERGQQLILAGEGLGLAVLEIVDGAPVVRGEASFPHLASEPAFFNAVVADDTRAYAGGPSGLFVFDLTDLSQPRPLRRYSSYAVLGLALSGQTLAALLPNGVQLFDLDGALLVPGDFLALTEPTGLAVDGSALWTIDGSGLSRYLLTGQGHGQLANQLATSGLNGAPVIDGTRLWAPRGSQLALFDIADPSQPQPLGEEETGIQPIAQVLPTPDGLYVIGEDAGYGTCRFFEVDADLNLVPYLRFQVVGARKGLARKDGRLVFTAPDNVIVVVEERLNDPPTLMAEGLFDGITDLAINDHYGFVADAQGVTGIHLDSVDALTVSAPFGPADAKLALDGDFLYAMYDTDLDIIDATDVDAPSLLGTKSFGSVLKAHVTQGKLCTVRPEGMSYYNLTNHQPTYQGNLGFGEPRDLDFLGTMVRGVGMSDGYPYFLVSGRTWTHGVQQHEVYDLASLDNYTKVFAVGDHLQRLLNGYIPEATVKGVHSRHLQNDGSKLWTDQLGQVHPDRWSMAVRRFELPMNGTMAVSGDRALVQDGQHVGLYDLSTMTPAAVYPGPGPELVRHVSRQGHDLWLACDRSGIYRISDEDGGLREREKLNISGQVFDVTVRDTTLFVQFYDRLVAYDIADPDQPVVLGELPIGWRLYFKSRFVGDKLLVNDFELKLIDVQDPTDMKVYASIHSFIDGVVQYGNLLYVTDNDQLCVYRAEDLSLVGCTNFIGGYVGNMVVIGKTLYARTGTELFIYDLTDPEQPALLNTVAMGSNSILSTDGTYLFRNGNRSRTGPVEVYNVEDPAHPVLVASLPNGEVLSAEPENLLVYSMQSYSLTRYNRTCSSVLTFRTMLPDWPNSDVRSLVQAAADLCGP